MHPLRRRSDWPYIALGVQVFLVTLGLGMAAPILPLYARSFGLSVTAVGFLVAVFGLARIGADLPTGHLAERLGRRPVLVGGALAVAAGSFGFALARTYPELVLSRLLQGLGSAAATTAAAIAVTEIAPAEERGRALGLYQGTLLLGTGAGPVIGGFLAQFLGPRAPFFTLGILALASSLWAARIPERERAPSLTAPAAVRAGGANDATGSAAWSPWRHREFWLVSLFTVMVFASRSGGQNTLLPLFGSDRLHLSESAIGLAFTLLMAFNVGAIYLSGALSDRFGRKRVIVPGGLITAGALAALPFAAKPWAFFAICAVFGLGIGISGTAPAAFIADITPPDRLGPTMGLYRTVADLGLMGGPVLFGWMAEVLGYAGGFGGNAVGLGLAASVMGLAARERPRVPRSRRMRGNNSAWRT